MALARTRWHQRVTLRGIGRATQLDYRSLGHLGGTRQQRIYIGALRGLCWYFDCQPSALLTLDGVEGPPEFTRITPPTGPLTGEIVSVVSQQIAPFRTQFLVDHLQISRAAVADLRRQPFTAISQATLVALCQLISAPSLDPLLRYDPQLQVHPADAPLDQVTVVHTGHEAIPDSGGTVRH